MRGTKGNKHQPQGFWYDLWFRIPCRAIHFYREPDLKFPSVCYSI